MKLGDLTGVILAAGRGSRMQPFSTRLPKPLLPVCNRPLLAHQLDAMRTVGIRNVVIVVGHKGFEITRCLGSGRDFGVDIHYVEQEAVLGIAHAVGTLEKHIANPFLLFLGDIFFCALELSAMVDQMFREAATCVLAAKREDDPEAIKKNFAIIINEDGTVRRVIEKPRYTQNKLKGCGLYLFDLPIFDAIRRTPRTAMRDEYEITDSIQLLIEDYPPVKVAEVVERDINLTTPDDLLRANLFQLRRMGQTSLVGQDANIHSGATLDRTVVGDRATVKTPIRLTECVVFADTVVDIKSDCEGFIFTPDSVIDCRNVFR